MPRLAKVPALVLVLIAGLLIGPQAAQAVLFQPDQPSLNSTGAVREARAQIVKLRKVRNPGKGFIATASRQNSRIFRLLNQRRDKRNRERADYLDGKLEEFAGNRIGKIEQAYDDAAGDAKLKYRRDVDRIEDGNLEGKRRKEALRRVKRVRDLRLANLSDERDADLDRANELIARTRRENFELYEKIAALEMKKIDAIKTTLRNLLDDLRPRV